LETFDTVVDATIEALQEMKRSGVTHVEVSRQTLESLGQSSVVVGAASSPRPGEDRTQEGAPTNASSASAELTRIEARARSCVLCRELSRCRHSVVFGIGNPHAELMFIGEAPGADEDAQGEPFVGRAGQLLTKIIQAMGYRREDVYISNVLKCRPPQNRTPLPDEVTNCLPYLLSQIELIQPKVIVALGATAVRSLLDVQLGITKMRGRWYNFRDFPIMPTFHPAYLLRNPAAKREVWEDMKAVMEKLGHKPPAEQGTRT
jgi:uracil-DNA glycosylase family 4